MPTNILNCSSPPASKKARTNTAEPRRRTPLRPPGVARRHAASRHDAPRILLRNRALRCALRRN
eukprot:10507015-Alexandrium_andersonii.AAC.1